MRVAAQRTESNEFTLFSAHIVPPASPSSSAIATVGTVVDNIGYQYDNTSIVTSITGDRKLIHNGHMSIQGSTMMSLPHGDISNTLTLNYGNYGKAHNNNNNNKNINGNNNMITKNDNGDESYHIQAISYDNSVFTLTDICIWICM